MLLRDCPMRLRSEGGVGFYIWSFGRWMMDGICWNLEGVVSFLALRQVSTYLQERGNAVRDMGGWRIDVARLGIALMTIWF